MRRRVGWRLLAVAGFAGAVMLLGATPADAKLDDPCSASGVVDGETYDPKVTDEAEGLPASGDVAWQGAVDSPSAPAERAVSGEVVVDLPGGIGSVTVGSWGDTSDEYAKNGTYEYDVPSVLEGIPIPVSGYHEEAGIRCKGSITVTIGESGIGSPAAIPALVLTALSAVGLVVAIRAGG